MSATKKRKEDEKQYIRLLDKGWWFGLSPLGIYLKSSDDIVECPDLDKEIEIIDIYGRPTKTKVGEVVSNAVKFGIIEIIDKDKKESYMKLKEWNEKQQEIKNEIARKRTESKFKAVLDKKIDDFKKDIDDMMARFVSKPDQIIVNLEYFKELESSKSKPRRKYLEYIDKCISQVKVKDEDSVVLNKETGELEKDEVIVKGADAVTADV